MSKFTPKFAIPILEQKLPFGRFEGCTWDEICKSYPSYALWAATEWRSILTVGQAEKVFDQVIEYHPNIEETDEYEEYLMQFPDK